MGLGVSGCISDTQSEIHSQVGQQSRNHILQTSPAVACHESLLLPQLFLALWRVEFSSVEQQDLAPVKECTVTRINIVTITISYNFVCANFSCMECNPSFSSFSADCSINGKVFSVTKLLENS